MEYYNLRGEFLSKPLVMDLIENKKYTSGLMGQKITGEELRIPGLSMFFMETEKEQYLFAYADSKVIMVEYEGISNLKEYTELLDQRLNNYTKISEDI